MITIIIRPECHFGGSRACLEIGREAQAAPGDHQRHLCLKEISLITIKNWHLMLHCTIIDPEKWLAATVLSGGAIPALP
jgi:hypothetical protein